jgi:general secretion pathway protein M
VACHDGSSLVYRQKHHRSAYFEGTKYAERCFVFLYRLVAAAGDFADTQQQRAARSQALADWIETNRQALIQSGKQGTASAGQTARGGEPTIAQITSSAAQFGITLSRLQPESDGSVSVAVEQQSFNALVQWLAGIESEQGYVIDRASIDRGSEEGLVNGQFRFR